MTRADLTARCAMECSVFDQLFPEGHCFTGDLPKMQNAETGFTASQSTFECCGVRQTGKMIFDAKGDLIAVAYGNTPEQRDANAVRIVEALNGQPEVEQR